MRKHSGHGRRGIRAGCAVARSGGKPSGVAPGSAAGPRAREDRSPHSRSDPRRAPARWTPDAPADARRTEPDPHRSRRAGPAFGVRRSAFGVRPPAFVHDDAAAGLAHGFGHGRTVGRTAARHDDPATGLRAIPKDGGRISGRLGLHDKFAHTYGSSSNSVNGAEVGTLFCPTPESHIVDNRKPVRMITGTPPAGHAGSAGTPAEFHVDGASPHRTTARQMSSTSGSATSSTSKPSSFSR